MEVEKVNSIEQNSSMEELKVEEDENIKENSLEEDILGAQSLLMSDTDEENSISEINRSKSSLDKISLKRAIRILESDEEDENPENKIENDNSSIKRNKKISALIDSDSSEEIEKKEYEPDSMSKGFVVSASDYEEVSNVNFKQLKQNLKKKPKSKTSQANKNYKNAKKSKESKKSNHKSSSDSEDNKTDKKTGKISQTDSKLGKSGYRTETENETDLEIAAREAGFENNNNNAKAVRASAKKALNEMQAIQSEQQRLHREAHISIPYHKPKKHTLEQFLKRHTIIQPSISANNASHVAIAIQAKRLKMTSEELEEYAKLMEERAKEATEFFKSESENESEEEVFKDNEGILDNPLKSQQYNDDITPKESLNILNERLIERGITNKSHDNILEGEGNLTGVQLTQDEFAELLVQQNQNSKKENIEIAERPTCSKVIITEVIELPKLDMNTVRISPIKKHTARPSLNIKQLIADKKLSGSPSLNGGPNKLIDLETGDLIEKKPTGIENLMKRLMSTVKNKKTKLSETCNILSVENGKLEISKVNINLTETKDVQKEPKPGAAYFELKKNLKEIIKKKRLEEINKKQEDDQEYSTSLADDDNDNSDDVDENEEIETKEYEPDNKPTNKVIMVDDEENALVVEEDEEEIEEDVVDILEFNNDEESEENNDNYNKDEDNDVEHDNNDNEKITELTQKTGRKNRIITGFADSDEEGINDDIDFLKTQPPVTQLPLFETQISQKTSLEDNEAELLTLCSGIFDTTQKTAPNAILSQIPKTQSNGETVNDEELIELCSGAFDQPVEYQSQTQTNLSLEIQKTKCNKILSSDEEDEDGLETRGENKQRFKKLTKKLEKKKAKLGFSDDEDEEEEYDDEEEFDENYTGNDVENGAEEPEEFVDYDSEENEILVQMTKRDRVKEAQNFVEREAELSESEWGSADEDEKNLDTYDIELGDEDVFDKEELRTELGQIHARKMLDEDIREVRKIQEMLLEDEEKDGVGRQRTFKWKNAENGFSLDDSKVLEENGDGQNGDSGDEINEHQWRKIRYEREQFLKEQGLKPDSQDMSTILSNTTIPLLDKRTTSMITTKKLQIITAKKSSVSISDSKKSSPFLISKGISAMNKKSVRGSFLVRDQETLNKLAGFTKSTVSSFTASNNNDATDTVSIKSIKPKNFVFATLTEEEHENLKRKTDELLNSSNENGQNFMKKPKLEPRRDKCFIDQLL